MKTISVHIKSPKIDIVGARENIEVIQLDNFMCPIAAFEKYKQISKLNRDSNLPVFRLVNGGCFTGNEVNRRLSQLTSCLAKHIPGGNISSHSFRSGVSSEMAR